MGGASEPQDNELRLTTIKCREKCLKMHKQNTKGINKSQNVFSSLVENVSVDHLCITLWFVCLWNWNAELFPICCMHTVDANVSTTT